MARNLAYLIGVLLVILLGIYFYCSCCNWCNNVNADSEPQEKEIIVETVPKATSFPFALSDNDFSYEVNDNFNFNASSPSFLMPLPDSIEKGVDTLRTHLSQNEGRVLNITGYYTSDEENGSAYPNLGIARANSVKNHLVSNGIASKQINTQGKLKDDMVPDEDIYLGPVAFKISAKDENANDMLKALYDEIKANPLVLYFESGEAAISLSSGQRQKVANISRYLDKANDASCQVIGHTDNTGSRATNIALGQERADFAKAYLMHNGIMESKINSSSDGPDNPIAPNTTAKGRAKNRRVIITVN